MNLEFNELPPVPKRDPIRNCIHSRSISFLVEAKDKTHQKYKMLNEHIAECSYCQNTFNEMSDFNAKIKNLIPNRSFTRSEREDFNSEIDTILMTIPGLVSEKSRLDKINYDAIRSDINEVLKKHKLLILFTIALCTSLIIFN